MKDDKAKLADELKKFAGTDNVQPASQPPSPREGSGSSKKGGCGGCFFKTAILLVVAFLVFMIIGAVTSKNEADDGGESAQQENGKSDESPALREADVRSLSSDTNSAGTQAGGEVVASEENSIVSFKELSENQELILKEDIVFRDEENMSVEVKKGSRVRFLGINDAGVVTIVLDSKRYIRHEVFLEGKMDITPR